MEGPCGFLKYRNMPVKLSSLHIPEKPPGMLDQYSWIYMMCSSSRRALYTGVTGDLNQRVFQHKNRLVEGFTKKYKCHRLVYYESFPYIGEAIAREKEIKGWRREKKNALVEAMNPQWRDLSTGLVQGTQGPSTAPARGGACLGMTNCFHASALNEISHDERGDKKIM